MSKLPTTSLLALTALGATLALAACSENPQHDAGTNDVADVGPTAGPDAGTADGGTRPPPCYSTSAGCCADDSECPGTYPICDTDTGLCGNGCDYDFAADDTVGCRSDLVCNVIPRFLDEKLPNYGAGTCANSCTSDSQCKALRSDFVCMAEKGSAPRCRPPGCIDDLECGNTPSDNPYKAFCQRSTGLCICAPSDPNTQCFCRYGDAAKDPVTGAELKDCKAGFKCDQGMCVAE